MSKLYLLMNRKSSLTVENKLKTVKTIYISLFLYGNEIWTTATPRQQKFLDKPLLTRKASDTVFSHLSCLMDKLIPI